MALASFTGVYAQDDAGKKEEEEKKEKVIGYGIALDVSNAYYWRGYEYYYPAMEKAGTPDSIFNLTPGIFPSLTFEFPAGFSFNIWSAIALASRTADTADLQSADEFDLTLAYELEDISGTFNVLMTAYIYPTANSLGEKATSYPEITVAYTAPWDILNPSVLLAAAFGSTAATQYQYAALSISHEFELGALTIGPKLSAGYWIGDQNAHIDLTLPFTYNINDDFEIHVGAIACYRLTEFDTGSPFILMANLGTSYSF